MEYVKHMNGQEAHAILQLNCLGSLVTPTNKCDEIQINIIILKCGFVIRKIYEFTETTDILTSNGEIGRFAVTITVSS